MESSRTLIVDSRMEAAQASAALTRRFEGIATNLANAETDGFKRVVGSMNLDSQEGLRAALARDFSQGPLKQTGAPEDLALEGPGYLAVEFDGDVAYTRAVRISSNAEGYLVDQRGLRVLGQGGPIRVGVQASQLEIGKDGEVFADNSPIGRLALSEFAAPQELRRVASGLVQPDAGNAPQESENTIVLQRMRERSNVDPLQEMIAMITVQRQFEAAQRAMNRSDTMTESLVRSLR